MPFKFNPLTGSLDLVNSEPTGTANKFAWFDSSGNLDSLNNWTVNSLAGAETNQTFSAGDSGLGESHIFNNQSMTISPSADLTTDYLYGKLNATSIEGSNDINSLTNREYFVQHNGTGNITTELTNLFARVQLGSGGGGTTSNNTFATRSHLRVSGGHTANTLRGVDSQISMDGATTASNASSFFGSTYIGGTSDYASGLAQYVQVDGAVNNNVDGVFVDVDINGTANNLTALSSNVQGDLTGNYQGIRSEYNGDIAGSSTHISIYQEGAITGNALGIDYVRNGSFTDFILFNANLNNASTTSNNLSYLNFSNSATVGANLNSLNLNQTGDVTGTFNGLGVNINANVGDNINIVSANIGPTSVDSNITGLNLFNQADFTGGANRSLWGVNVNNTAPGYRITGLSLNNTGNMAEEIRGFQFVTSGNSRTSTAIDLSLTGVATDDVQGMRLNMLNQSSTNQEPTGIQIQMPNQTRTDRHVNSLSIEGGVLGIQSQMNPISGGTVDIGNNIAVLSTVPAGSPLTGTDQIITLVQSNLRVQDDISTGPIGLDTTMLGGLSQVDVSSGKTAPLLRSMLVGTSVPSGSGGTITEHVVMELLGLPSFGGSVTNPTRIGIQDAQLLGQNFSDGATDVWGLRWRDANSEHYLARLAIDTPTFKVANSSVGFEIGGVTKSFLNARMTTLERDALTALNGMQIYNTTTDKLQVFAAGVWTDLH